jgi:hypothetical protein
LVDHLPAGVVLRAAFGIFRLAFSLARLGLLIDDLRALARAGQGQSAGLVFHLAEVTESGFS